MEARSGVFVSIILVLAGPLAGALPAPEPDEAASDGGRTWSRDLDGDRIDDAILALELGAPTSAGGVPLYAAHALSDGWRYDVFLRLDHEPTSTDVTAVEAVVPHAHVRAFPLAHAIRIHDVPRSFFAALLSVSGAEGIELERTVVATLNVAPASELVVSSPELGVGARGRWKVNGHGSVIAILDSGIDNEHEAFGIDQILGGYDATIPIGSVVSGLARTAGLPLTGTPLDERDPDDNSGSSHGTHVAGIAAGTDPNLTAIGIAPAARLLDVKVLTNTTLGGTSSTPFGVASMVLEGLEFVRRYNAGLTYLGEPGNDTVDIVSMSLAETSPDPAGDSVLARAVDNLVHEGVVVVAAAGNCGPGGLSSCSVQGEDVIAAPGSARHAITVGAVEDKGTVIWDDDTVAPYSSRGPSGGEQKPNVAAYGTDILSPHGTDAIGGAAVDNYTVVSGTSFAAPMVSGLVALVLEANRSLDPEAVKAIIMRTARDVAEPGWDPATGAGVINAYYAVGVALGFIDPDTVIIDATGHDIEEQPLPPPVEAGPEQPRSIVNQAPRVDFTFGPVRPAVGTAVVFVDRSVDPEGRGLVARNWDFGDGETEKGDRVVHTYARAGTYTVRLTVTDVNGTAGSLQKDIVVAGGAGAKESAAHPFVISAVAIVLLALVAGRLRAARCQP